jgi:hypothetical protein
MVKWWSVRLVDGSLKDRPQQPCKQRSELAATEAEIADAKTNTDLKSIMASRKERIDEKDSVKVSCLLGIVL